MADNTHCIRNPAYYKEKELEATTEAEKRTLRELRKAHKRQAPYDPRYPNTNQVKYCWQNFVDFQRCIKVKGEDYVPCDYFKSIYNSVCPMNWLDKWTEQLDEGRFPAKI